MWLARLFIREWVAGLTSNPEYPAILCPGYSVLGEGVNHPIHGELTTVLTSDPAYPAILYSVLQGVISYVFHEGTGCCEPEYLMRLCPKLFGPAGGD